MVFPNTTSHFFTGKNGSDADFVQVDKVKLSDGGAEFCHWEIF